MAWDEHLDGEMDAILAVAPPLGFTVMRRIGSIGMAVKDLWACEAANLGDCRLNSRAVRTVGKALVGVSCGGGAASEEPLSVPVVRDRGSVSDRGI
jgi:hypothetical protein